MQAVAAPGTPMPGAHLRRGLAEAALPPSRGMPMAGGAHNPFAVARHDALSQAGSGARAGHASPAAPSTPQSIHQVRGFSGPSYRGHAGTGMLAVQQRPPMMAVSPTPSRPSSALSAASARPPTAESVVGYAPRHMDNPLARSGKRPRMPDLPIANPDGRVRASAGSCAAWTR